MGTPMQRFLAEFVEGARDRNEVIHFVTAREMVNMILAACDGREGNPGEYRDYRLKLTADAAVQFRKSTNPQVSVRG